MSATPEPPLPYGWVRQFHQESGHPFYVDTKANPPRSIWVHPYEDEQYLSEHPDTREKTGSKYSPPSTPIPQSPSTGSPKRGFLGKIKDKAIGTREEREEEKRRAAMVYPAFIAFPRFYKHPSSSRNSATGSGWRKRHTLHNLEAHSRCTVSLSMGTASHRGWEWVEWAVWAV
ncbi:hypothetical protein FPV67DRAFT_1466362 [Lyophyllum atratum]|nr:hypothetical protein FPV67DRAFT_1466362 [Lyophyllum atratum]